MGSRFRTAVAAVALAVWGAVAGVLCAQALGQVELPTVTLPSVSVTVPSLPLPAPPAPPPPAPAVAINVPPSPAVSLPAPPAPPIAPAPSPVPAAAPPPPLSVTPASVPSPSGPQAGSTASSSAPTAQPRRPSARSRAKPHARVTRLKASPQRFGSGSKRGTRITFRLSAPARVTFVVRGPAPSCQVAGRFSVMGRKGTNRVRFRGRVGRRTLDPGTYVITAHPAGRTQRSRPIVVIVGTPARRELDCSSKPRGFELPALYIDAGDASSPVTGSKAAVEEDSRGVLPAIARRLREVPAAVLPKPELPDRADSPPLVLGLLALALLALAGLALLGYVIRFLRDPRTKSV